MMYLSAPMPGSGMRLAWLTKMASVCAHLVYCHGCAPSGASMCPLCDAVVLTDQWVNVRQV